MPSQYDSIGDSYVQIKTIPLIRYLEIPAFRAAVEPHLSIHAGEHRVLDLACGDGFYSRLLLSWGASSVCGIDISPSMIDAARTHPDTGANESRLAFRVGDARDLSVLPEPPFDIVTGVWLLNYATSGAEMTNMWETIARNLRPGGVFVGITVEPVDDLATYVAQQRSLRARNTGHFGFDVDYHEEPPLASGEGYYFRFTPLAMERAFSLRCCHLTKSVYEAAARKGGMKGRIEWRVMEVTDEAKEAAGKELQKGYWDHYEEMIPKFAVMIVHK
ncbi:methyltransferase type 11 [Mycena galopus ATCC 62051]|nr:methyltransferase type 11 [Mycena galopus ATCC 62051]